MDKKPLPPLSFSSQAPSSDYDGSMSAAMAMQGFAVDGLTFVYAGDECVADFQIEKGERGWSLHSHVAQAWRRRGVASFIYDQVREQALAAGKALGPSEFQTSDALAFWASWGAKAPQGVAEKIRHRRAQAPRPADQSAPKP